MKNKTELLEPIHPGEILQEEFMAPLGLTINALSRDLHVPVTRISEIVNKRRGITGDTALRLARYFRNTAQFWLNLQTRYHLMMLDDRRGRIEKGVRPLAKAA